MKEIFNTSVWYSGISVDTDAENLTKVIRNAINKSVPNSNSKKFSDNVWNDALETARRKMRKLRKIYQKSVIETEKQNNLNRYRQAKDKFKKLLHETRNKSWKTFVENHLENNTWGIPYKIIMDKIKKPETLNTLEREDGSMTKNWEDTSKCLLKTLLPDDNISTDVLQNSIKRIEMNTIYNNNRCILPFDISEIELIFRKLKKKKSCGPDNIPNEVLMALQENLIPYLCLLFNDCLWKGQFPACWKVARVIILKKGLDKDPVKPKSYRPICLLNAMGKIFEHLINKRINEFRDMIGRSDKQYGFRKERSTEDAIYNIMQNILHTNKKYVIGVFIDISGAFDNLWWPFFFDRLRKQNYPKALYKILISYCNNRKVYIQGIRYKIWKEITKGCPQGSVLGPTFWDIVMDTLLEEFDKDDAINNVIAYADDVIFLIDGDSSAEIQRKAKHLTLKLAIWCKNTKLEIAPHKSNYMLLKGNLKRNPILKYNNKTIKRCREIKYLGVILDEKLNFIKHADYVRNKAEVIMQKLSRIVNTKFKISLNKIITYHYTIFGSIINYAAGVWVDKLTKQTVKNKLRSSQRKNLLRHTGAVCTTPTMALLIITGVWPIDLPLRLRGATYWTNKQNWDKVNKIIGNRCTNTQEIKRSLIMEWQEEWDTIKEGRRTHEFFPSILERFKLKHVKPTKGLVHFLTGHGPYGTYWQKINKIMNPNCSVCNVIDNPEHVLFECTKYDIKILDARNPLRGHTLMEILREKALYDVLANLANDISDAAWEVKINTEIIVQEEFQTLEVRRSERIRNITNIEDININNQI